MAKITVILLILLMLCGCGSEEKPLASAEPYQPSTETAEVTETVPPTTVPPTTVPPTPETTVPLLDESWFDDALFIGESRTAGLKGHGRLGGADYFCGEGLTVYGVFGIQTSDLNFSEQTLTSLFSWKQYGKIYIHLGINELGGNLDSFVIKYQWIIDEIHRLQPDAHIILQAVLALGEGYSARSCFSRESIEDLNNRIRNLAEENNLIFSDVNQIMTGEDGYLIPERTFDGCHLYSSAYEIWAQWMLEEANTYQIPKEKE